MLTRRDFLKFAAAGIVAAGSSLVLPSKDGVVEAAYPPASRCLWFSWDGADIRSLEDLLGQRLLPNLSQLHVVRLIAAPNTATKAGQSEAISGLGCDKTNIITNKRYNSRITEDKTPFYKIRQTHPGWFLSCIFSKRSHTGDRLVQGKREPWYHLKYWAQSGGMNRYFNPSTAPTELGGEMALEYTNERLTEHVAACRASGGPGYLVYCHWAHPDHTGHRHGMGSLEWNDAMVQLDAALGWAVAQLQPDAVFVYSDHGFDGFGAKQHLNAPHGFFASNFPLIADGIRWDVAVTVLSALGLPVATYTPCLMGRDLRL